MRLPTQKIHHVLTLLIAFSLPLDRRISPILIALLMLNWLLDWNWKEKVFNFRSNTIALLPLLLYLLYCLGMLYTENIRFGLKDLETKLSLLFFPLIFASKPALKKEDLHKILFYFTLGCGLAAIICFGHSIYLYYDEIRQVQAGTLHDTYTNVNFFFSSQLSYFMHPSYFAMYLSLAIGSMLYRITNLNLPQIKTLLLILYSIAFTISIFYLSSKMGIITTVIIWLLFFLHLIITYKWFWQGALLIIALGTATYYTIKSSEILSFKFKDAISAMEAEPGDSSLESSAVRITIWRTSKELIAKMPFIGFGTGDIHTELGKMYLKNGLQMHYEKKLNPHNQFFQTAITIGWTGLSTLLLSILLPAIFAYKNKNYIYLIFALLILLNALVESVLEIQVGVVFFSFFNSIITNASERE